MDGLNWYTYCKNNPIRYCDPTGNYAEALQWAPSLAEALPWLVGGVTAGLAGIKTAIATAWMPVIAIPGVIVAVAAIAVVTYQAVQYTVDAHVARTCF